MSIESTVTFILASALISIAPGPDNIFVLTQSALYGKKSGLLVTLGLCTGLIAHTMAVALGLAAIFQASQVAFNILKYIGAAYLVYLAWQAFKAIPAELPSTSERVLSYRALYIRGIVMNVTNPKVSLFFLAFLPQFTDPAHDNLAIQFIWLGVIFIAIALVIFSLISFMAGTLGTWFAQSPKGKLYLNRVAGVVFLGLATKLVTSNANA